MADSLPPPLVPAEVDLRGYEYMPLDVVRLMRSSSWRKARSQPELGYWMVNLWVSSWHEVPAASLPDDDDELADFARCEPKVWAKVKVKVLAGWVKCSDGRLYHPVVSEKALESWAKMGSQRKRTQAAREALKQKLLQQQAEPVTEPATPPVAAPVTETATAPNQREEKVIEVKGREEVEGAGAPPPPPAAEPQSALVLEPDDGMPAFLVAGEPGEALKLWNETAERIGLPIAQKLTDSRRRGLKARLSESGGLDGWRTALAKVEASSFLTGKTGRGDGHENWRCDLDFILRQTKFTKLMEGGFDDAPGHAKPRSGLSSSLEALAEFGRTGTG